MKNLIIAGAIALSSTFAVADTSVNLKKVNKVVKSVVDSEVTPLITKVELKFDEKSNLESIEKLKVGASLSATAKESAWSKKPTTVDVKADVKTINSDPAHTKMELAATLGSKTDAVSLYAYVAAQILKSSEGEPVENENDQAFRDLFAEAAKTTQLDQIPAQLEKLIVLIKTEIALEPQDDDAAWTDLMNSLKVDTKVQNFKTKEVILKTSVVVPVEFFENTIVISNLSLTVSETGLSLNATLGSTEETSVYVDMLEKLKATLSMIENADAETLAGLKDMANGYVGMAEEIVKGDLE